MKKSVLAIIMVLTMLLSFTSCIPKKYESLYDSLNKLCDVNYNKITVDVTSITSDGLLNAEYVLTSNQVTYEIEKFNMLPTDGSFSDVPLDYKTTFSGTAEIENGQVVKLDDAPVTLPSYDTLKGSFNFDEANFTDVITSDGQFDAKVVSPSSFMGATTDVTDMSVTIEYSESAFVKITLSYRTAHSKVTTVYSFE